jgi:hypothetical protein
MSMPHPLAYEIRRLATLIARRHGEDPDRAPAPPGELALRIVASFEIRPIDADIALAILAAELDFEFREVLYADSARSELAVLATLVPRLEDRLALADAVGRDAAAVKRGLLRRIDSTGELTVTRRFRAAVYGRPLLSELPDYVATIEDQPQSVPWARPPYGLLDSMSASQDGTLCVVHGGPGVGKTTWASHAAHLVAGAALRIDASKAATVANASSELRELVEDATMMRWAVVIDNAGELLRSETRFAVLLENLLDSVPVKMFVVLGDGESVIERIASRALGVVRIEPPDPLHRRALWNVTADPSFTTLADDLVLAPRQIANARRLIAAGADAASAAFEQLTNTHNLTLPDRSSSKLDMLVLPTEVRDEVVEVIAAIRARGTVLNTLPVGRGRAITALLDGDSGTGKTFSCEVIAAEVGLPLMRVNVSSLVDKYIGETEKNLARVFAQAQAQGGILFFDEADALFGTRTEVSRATDRYANLETNLLLQLMEQFSGVVLLTTNLKRNIDQAFMRRIMFKVYFENPEPPERERLWKTVLGTSMFADDIDFRRVAQTFELTGGSIRAALLRAAYRATAAKRKIQMTDLVECAQLETQAMGRVATW